MIKRLALISTLSCALLGAKSLSELTEYPRFCQTAAKDERLFKNFKRHPIYRNVLEHITYEQGLDYLALIEKESPHILSALDKFAQNDTYGSPVTYDYHPYGPLSPTTIRYMKIAGEILNHFGDLNGKKIVEIGVGYGGQCKILSDLVSYESYTLIDLPEAALLAEKYLKKLDVPSLRFFDRNHLPDDETFDLLISNYAFSEITKEEQIGYIQKILNRSKNGYMLCNFITGLYGLHSFNLEELLAKLKMPGREISLLAEVPLTHPNNLLIVWKET
jgi:hypothetical protein